MSRETREPDQSTIVPRIKHRDFLSTIQSMNLPPESLPVMEPLVADLLVTYAFDLPHAFQMVMAADQERLGLSKEEMREIAIANLREQLDAVDVQGDPPVVRVIAGNNLDACLLLCDEIWETLAETIPPDLVVAVPTRDLVLVTTTRSTKGGVDQIRRRTKEARETDRVHGLSDQLLIRKGDRWEVFA